MKRFLFLALVVTSLESCFSKNTADNLTEEEVVAVVRSFDKSWNTKDANGTDAVLSPAYVYFTPSGGLFPRDSIIATAGSPTYQLDRVNRDILSVNVSGNSAIVNTRWKGKGTYRGEDFNDDQRCSITVVKKDGVVSILSEHCSSINKGISLVNR
jgi:hypothetical protein